MGTPVTPDDGTRNVSFQTPPQARYTVSPGASVAAASRAMVCHGPLVPAVNAGARPV
ncbi:MAG: hypothetical protein LH632_12670 [Rhodoferax sp.]|nr:hypothetical protein [Rhodoferax sp.]